jgi:CRP/FNR family cyclic AMP-dependent transcriptional regulator
VPPPAGRFMPAAGRSAGSVVRSRDASTQRGAPGRVTKGLGVRSQAGPARPELAKWKPLLADGWLSRQPTDFQEAILLGSQLRKAASGQCIRMIGDEPGGIFAVVDGAVAICIAGERFGPHVIDVRLPGDWGGACSFLSHEPRRHGIEAMTETTMLVVPPDLMQRMVRHDAENLRQFAALVSEALARARRAIADLMIPAPTARLAATLLRAAGDRATILPLTQERLAIMANVSRKIVNRAMQGFRDEGWIAFGYGSVRLIDPAALATCAQGGDARTDPLRIVPAGTVTVPDLWN